MTYVEAQNALASSEAGKLAITLTPGSRLLRPEGDVVTVWMAWRPDLAGDAIAHAEKYQTAPPGPDHNTEIGITGRNGTERVKVADLECWEVVPPGGCTFRRYFHDKGPDGLGRRRFALCWEEPGGVFRPEPSKLDGEPVGYRRAQCFHTDPVAQTRDLERRGHVVLEPNERDPYEVAAEARRGKRPRKSS